MNQEVEIEYSEDQTRITLPIRESAGLRRFGWIVITAGIVTIVSFFAVFPIGSAAVGLIPGLGLIYIGISFVNQKTRCLIRWSHNSLETVEYFGAIKWVRSCNAAKVNRFVYSSILNENTIDFARYLPKGLENLTLEIENRDEPYPFVYWYPRSVLEQIIYELVPRLELKYRTVQKFDSQISETLDEEIEVGEPIAAMQIANEQIHEIDVLEHAEHASIIRKPADSRVRLERHDQAIVFKVPPKGFWDGSGNLSKFSVIILLAIIFGTLGHFSSIIQGNTPWWKVIYPIPWLIGGTGLFAYCYRMGTANVTIGASSEMLWIEQKDGFTQDKIDEFDRSEFKRVTAKLNVIDLKGNAHPIFTALSEREKHWIACELNMYFRDDQLASS